MAMALELPKVKMLTVSTSFEEISPSSAPRSPPDSIESADSAGLQGFAGELDERRLRKMRVKVHAAAVHLELARIMFAEQQHHQQQQPQSTPTPMHQQQLERWHGLLRAPRRSSLKPERSLSLCSSQSTRSVTFDEEPQMTFFSSDEEVEAATGISAPWGEQFTTSALRCFGS